MWDLEDGDTDPKQEINSLERPSGTHMTGNTFETFFSIKAQFWVCGLPGSQWRNFTPGSGLQKHKQTPQHPERVVCVPRL